MIPTATIINQLNSAKVKKVTIEIICFLFIILFTYAALTKLAAYDRFIVQVARSPLIANFGWLLPWGIPAVELVIAVLLTMTRFRRVALYASFSLMVMFTAYVIAILQFSEYIPCSCGGVLSGMGWTEHLIFNIGFVILAASGIVIHSSLKENKSPAMV